MLVQIVGVVEQLGSSVTHLKKGDTVGFGWFKNCCQHCDACITGNDVSPSLTHFLPTVSTYSVCGSVVTVMHCYVTYAELACRS